MIPTARARDSLRGLAYSSLDPNELALRQQLANQAAAVDDRHRPSVGRVELFGWIDAKQMVDGGGEILGAVRVGGRAFGALVGPADNAAALDAAASQGHGNRL